MLNSEPAVLGELWGPDGPPSDPGDLCGRYAASTPEILPTTVTVTEGREACRHSLHPEG